MALVACLAVAAYARFGNRRSPTTGTLLQPSSRTGSDLVYPYYVDSDQLKTIAAGVNVEIPVSRGQEMTDGAAVGPTGASVKTEVKLKVELATQLNLAAFARRLRDLDAEYVADRLAIAPDDWEKLDEPSLIAGKVAEFVEVGTGKTVLLRGQLEPIREDRSDEMVLPIHLRLTHLSREMLHDDVYPGTGDFAVLRVPPALEIVMVLHDPDALMPSGRERLSREEPFFGEVIATSPGFDTESGRFTCAAVAVWGCAQPQPTGEDGF